MLIGIVPFEEYEVRATSADPSAPVKKMAPSQSVLTLRFFGLSLIAKREMGIAMAAIADPA